MARRRPRRAVKIFLVLLFLLAFWGVWTVHVWVCQMKAEALLHQVGYDIAEYASDHANHLPALTNLAAFQGQIGPYDAYYARPPLVVPGTDIPYLTNPALSGKGTGAVPADVETVILYPARPFYGGRDVLIVLLLPDGWDMMGRFIPEARWQRMTAGGKVLSFPDTGPSALYSLVKD